MASRKTIETRLRELDTTYDDHLTPVGTLIIDAHHVNERMKSMGHETRAKFTVIAQELDAQNGEAIKLKDAVTELDDCVDRRFDELDRKIEDHHAKISERIDEQNKVASDQGALLAGVNTHVSGLVFTARENERAFLALDTTKRQAEINEEADKRKNRRERWTKMIGFALGLVGLVELALTHLHC